MTATPHDPSETDIARHLRLRSPRAIAAAIPHLTGPLPDCALSLLVFDGEERAREVYSRELPEPPGGDGPASLGWAQTVGELASDGIRASDLRPGESVVICLQLPPPLFWPPAPYVPVMMRPLRGFRPRLLDLLVTCNGRYRSLLCTSEACCPADGQPIVSDPQAVEALRRLSLIARSRQLEPSVDDDLREEVARLLRETTRPRDTAERQALFHRVLPLVLGSRVLLAAPEAALLVLAADLPGVRDALLVRLADEPTDVWWTQLALWHNVAADSPQGWTAGPEAMAAIAAWMLDWGSKASAYARSALRERPNHRLAGLVVDALAKPLDGEVWLASLQELPIDTCLEFDRPPDLG